MFSSKCSVVTHFLFTSRIYFELIFYIKCEVWTEIYFLHIDITLIVPGLYVCVCVHECVCMCVWDKKINMFVSTTQMEFNSFWSGVKKRKSASFITSHQKCNSSNFLAIYSSVAARGLWHIDYCWGNELREIIIVYCGSRIFYFVSPSHKIVYFYDN